MKWCYYPHPTHAAGGTGSRAHRERLDCVQPAGWQSCFSLCFAMRMSSIQTLGFLFLLKNKYGNYFVQWTKNTVLFSCPALFKERTLAGFWGQWREQGREDHGLSRTPCGASPSSETKWRNQDVWYEVTQFQVCVMIINSHQLYFLNTCEVYKIIYSSSCIGYLYIM